MDDNSKILNPICIRLDNYFDILLKNIEGYSSCSLMPGIMVGGEHYGFVVISSKDGKQKERVYGAKYIDKIDEETEALKRQREA